MPHRTAADWIALLELKPLPDGGYYRETYRAPLRVGFEREGQSLSRPAATSILYLLTRDAWQAFHRLDHDEMWHFYYGSPCQLHLLHTDPPRYESILLGSDPERYQRFQALIPAGTWFGAEVVEPGEFGIVGCTVAPGFEWGDYQLATASDLIVRFPQYRRLIERLLRQLTESGD